MCSLVARPQLACGVLDHERMILVVAAAAAERRGGIGGAGGGLPLAAVERGDRQALVE